MKSALLGLLTLLPLIGGTSCGFLIAETATQPNSTARIVATEPKPTVPPAIAAAPTVTITRYKIDHQCQELLPTDLAVPVDSDPLDIAVKTIVGDRSNGDFRIAGYRLNIDENAKTATVDLRLPLDFPRSIYSLSHCEQFALLGEIRETLIANSNSKFNTVIFQIQGQPLEY
ncbi:MAG: sporulation/spore germination protein [Limnothrix sp. RL_2_0]|nr:sporulation/spore germination protein [Limnothrix sp. RL_2_0]